jgi:RNA polymerase sigma factor (sigma-70 family)
VSREDDIRDSVEQNRNRLFGFIRKRVRSDEDAEDILQEVWYQLSRIINLDEIESITAWLFRVARNKITDGYRKSGEESYDNWLDGEEGMGWREILFGEPENEIDEMYRELFWDTLMSALDELPENQKDVFVKTELEGLKLREVADHAGESIKTITSRKAYAVKHLRKRLKELYDEL